MRTHDIWRIAALSALILAALGLALGACMAKRSSDSGGSSATTPGTGGSAGMGSSVQGSPPTPDDKPAPKPDAGTETRAEPNKPPPPPGRPSPKPGMAVPKGHKGMLGQMHLQDGD